MDQRTIRRRTCISCGEQGEKAGLHRVVRTSEGVISFDPTGRKAGRGAYVCSVGCFENARKTGKLNRALKCNVSNEECEGIFEELQKTLEEA